MNVLIQQLLSYRKYRELMDSRFTHLLELKRELRNLREMDRLQERDSREIHTAKDNAAKMSNGRSNFMIDRFLCEKFLRKTLNVI